MAGYSGTPLAKKLGVAPGKKLSVVLVNAPPEFERLLEPFPSDATLTRRAPKHTVDVIVAFVKTVGQLNQTIKRFEPGMTGAQMLWLAWPKKSSGVATELNENIIREAALLAGLVDNKVCAIDDTWSGLRVVRRVKDRTT